MATSCRVPSADPAELTRLRAALRSSHRRRARDVEVRRRELERFAARLPRRLPAPTEAVTVGGVAAEWVGPSSSGGAIVHFHGGGYATGSPATHRQLAARLAEAAGVRVLVPDFRRAPEHPFPAAFEDALAVWHALMGRLGAERVVLGGDSAGGGLALALAADLARRGEAPPAGVFAFSPWTDLTHGAPSIDENRDRDPVVDREEIETMAKLYLGGSDAADPRASPLFGALAGMPPVRILVSDVETLRDDGIRFARRAGEAGVVVDLQVWTGQPHAWPLYAPVLADGARAVRETGRWARGRLSISPPEEPGVVVDSGAGLW